MKSEAFMLGIAVSSLMGDEYHRCEKCKKIFDIGDAIHTKTDEVNYHLCDNCFEVEE